jgi:hypothetical protein
VAALKQRLEEAERVRARVAALASEKERAEGDAQRLTGELQTLQAELAQVRVRPTAPPRKPSSR